MLSLIGTSLVCIAIGAPGAIAPVMTVIVALSLALGYMGVTMPSGSLFAGMIDVTDITFSGKEIREMSEAIMESAFENPELTEFHTIYEDIVAKEQIAFLGRLDKITKKDLGCGTGATSKVIPMSQKFWDPSQCKIWLEQCHKDLEASFFVWAKGKGIAQADLTKTDFAEFVIQRMEEAAIEDALRILWFNHKDAANVDDSPAGVLGTTVDPLDYNIIDGFWKQLFTIGTNDATRRYTITENAEASKVAQMALAADAGLKCFEGLKYNSDYRLRNAKDLVILSTQSLVDNYAKYLRSQGTEPSFTRIESGYSALQFEGITIIAFNFWDRTIAADFDNGTTYYRPHRALLTTKRNLAAGFDSKSAVSEFDVFYDKRSETNNFKGAYKVDAKVLEDYMVQVAY